MSRWCYILGAVIVDGFEPTEEANIFKVKTVLRHLPIITGSERPCYINALPTKEDDTSLSSDVDYPEPSNTIGRKDLMFDTFEQAGTRSSRSKYNWDAGSYRMSSNVMITLDGELRDVEFEQGLRAITGWLNRLSKCLYVRRIGLTLEDGRGKSFTFNNGNSEWLVRNLDDCDHDRLRRFESLINWSCNDY